MTIGVGVEGPSDYQFWDKVLHKHFRGHRFDVRNMKNRDKLIRETPRLIESFCDCHYAAGFTLVDMDDDPCVTAVLELFDDAVRAVARVGERAARSFHVCVAIKEIESWFLADAAAIQSVMPGCEWAGPEDTRSVAKGRLRRLYKTHFGQHASFNEIAFAKDIAPKFSPARAQPHSTSFRYFWGTLEQRVRHGA
ncbi:MAG: DUF4276 family protein [Terrimicrobiaceae bacterium]|nr:DUF4276 family protein [Terrimicrobiaceae bacterium]